MDQVSRSLHLLYIYPLDFSDSIPHYLLMSSATPTTPATHTITTDAGTFRAWCTGAETLTDPDTDQPYTAYSWLVQTPSGNTFGYPTFTTNNSRQEFRARVW